MKKPRKDHSSKAPKKSVRDLAPRKTTDTKGGLRSAAESKGQVQGELARFR